MQLPSRKYSPHLLVDEQGHFSEFSKYDELHRARENKRSTELCRFEEVQKHPTVKKPASKNGQSLSSLRLFTSSGMGIASVAATVAVASAVVLPAVTQQKSVPASTPPPYTESAPPLLPVIDVAAQTVGLDFLNGSLEIENIDAFELTVYLKDGNGQIAAQTAIAEDGGFSFAALTQDTAYTLCVENGEGEELFSCDFTTECFVTLQELEDETGLRATLHPDVPLQFDGRLELYDGEGKDFSYNVYMTELDEDTGGGADSSWDSTSDSSSGFLLANEYDLLYYGLYTGEYSVRFTYYPPEAEEEGRTYEKKIRIEGLAPLVYTPSYQPSGMTDVSYFYLEYRSGDVNPYQNFTLDVYKDGEYYDYLSQFERTGDSLSFELPQDLESGTYTFSLWGEDAQHLLFNEIWRGEITV